MFKAAVHDLSRGFWPTSKRVRFNWLVYCREHGFCEVDQPELSPSHDHTDTLAALPEVLRGAYMLWWSEHNFVLM